MMANSMSVNAAFVDCLGLEKQGIQQVIKVVGCIADWIQILLVHHNHNWFNALLFQIYYSIYINRTDALKWYWWKVFKQTLIVFPSLTDFKFF